MIIDKLATSLGRRDEVPNQELAKEIAGKGDTISPMVGVPPTSIFFIGLY